MEAQKQCEILHGQWNNPECKGFYAPDIFFFCILLALLCFVLSYGLRCLRNSRFFPTRVSWPAASAIIDVGLDVILELLFFLTDPLIDF